MHIPKNQSNPPEAFQTLQDISTSCKTSFTYSSSFSTSSNPFELPPDFSYHPPGPCHLFQTLQTSSRPFPPLPGRSHLLQAFVISSRPLLPPAYLHPHQSPSHLFQVLPTYSGLFPLLSGPSHLFQALPTSSGPLPSSRGSHISVGNEKTIGVAKSQCLSTHRLVIARHKDDTHAQTAATGHIFWLSLLHIFPLLYSAESILLLKCSWIHCVQGNLEISLRTAFCSSHKEKVQRRIFFSINTQQR